MNKMNKEILSKLDNLEYELSEIKKCVELNLEINKFFDKIIEDNFNDLESLKKEATDIWIKIPDWKKKLKN